MHQPIRDGTEETRIVPFLPNLSTSRPPIGPPTAAAIVMTEPNLNNKTKTTYYLPRFTVDNSNCYYSMTTP